MAERQKTWIDLYPCLSSKSRSKIIWSVPLFSWVDLYPCFAVAKCCTKANWSVPLFFLDFLICSLVLPVKTWVFLDLAFEDGRGYRSVLWTDLSSGFRGKTRVQINSSFFGLMRKNQGTDQTAKQGYRSGDAGKTKVQITSPDLICDAKCENKGTNQSSWRNRGTDQWS